MIPWMSVPQELKQVAVMRIAFVVHERTVRRQLDARQSAPQWLRCRIVIEDAA